MLICYSVLEQFDILIIFATSFFGFKIFLTNSTITLFFILGFYIVLFDALVHPKMKTLFLIPNNTQLIFEFYYKFIANLVANNIDIKNGQRFFPLIFTLFLFIVSINLIGLIPYSFTVTSHIIVTFAISFCLFLGINILSFQIHKMRFFSSFFPKNIAFILGLLLVPIEIISFIFKPVSLGIRLFANMMAGHTLLQVIAWFSISLIHAEGGFISILHIIPIMILIPLYALEFAVAIIQALVFCILISIYIKDSIYLH